MATRWIHYEELLYLPTNRRDVDNGSACEESSDSLQIRWRTCHGNEHSLAHFVQRALVVTVGLEGSVQHATPPGQSCKQGPAGSHTSVEQYTLAKLSLHTRGVAAAAAAAASRNTAFVSQAPVSCRICDAPLSAAD